MKLSFFLLFVSLSVYSQIPTIQWDKTFGGNGLEQFAKLIQANDGGFICIGSSNSPISGEKSEHSRGLSDYWIVKTGADGTLSWEKTLGGSSQDHAEDVVITDDGGYLIGGSSYSDASGDRTQPTRGVVDYWVVKLDSNGNLEWQKAYGGSGGDALYNVIETADGYLLSGISNSPSSGDKTTDMIGGSDLWLVKIDFAGQAIWQKSYGGTSAEFLSYASPTSDGGFIVGCQSMSGISGDRTVAFTWPEDAWILKLDSNGNLQWQAAFPMEEFVSVRQLADGGYAVAGKDRQLFGKNVSSFTDQANLIRLDNQGNLLWEYRGWPAYGDCCVNDLFEQTDGSIVAAIECTSTDANSALVNLSATGTVNWTRMLSVNAWTIAGGVKQTSDGFIVGLYSSSNISADKSENSRGLQDFWLVKFNGEQLTVGDTEKTAVSVFPNPVIDKLIIANAGVSNIELYNSLGQRLFSQAIDPIQSQIDFLYPSGTYFLKINGEISHTVKIIK